VQEVVLKQSEVQIKRFVVAGASKRGWTTWLTGAMDDRVVAIVPIVIDVLGVNESMRHHFAAYGYWAPAVGNYVQHRIMQRLDHPRIEELYRWVDPLAYQKRLDMPKLILNAAGDQFFLPDSSRFYFDKLPGEKHLRYVANTDHSMRGSDAFETLAAFYYSIAHKVRRPEYTWSVAEGKLRVESKNTPQAVVVWTAVNPDARDFRLETLGAAYKSRPLEEIADGVYETELIEPAEGWAAQFVELTYDIGAPVPLKLTTNVHVLPDVLPYAGRDPSQEATVTLKVRSQTAGRAVELATEAAGLMKSKLKIDDVESVVEKDVLYLNWQPRDFRAEAGAVMGWLESQAGVLQLNVQLESGNVITTVPKTSSATENQR
jgi:PhoPQ-activated pathogenicity-related protein